MAESIPDAGADPLAEAVRAHIHTVITIKTRLPFLMALSEELNRIGEGMPVRNDIVLRLANDSFDLMVIDMASLREGLTNGNGSTFNLLAQHTGRLRRFLPVDCDPHMQVIGETSPAAVEALNAYARQRLADGMNRSFDRLFPDGAPVTAQHIKALIARFRKDTEATDRDRNRVRAHRYERSFDASFRLDLAEAKQQLGVFEQYLGDLYLVLTKAAYIFNPPTLANVERTASDVADLIVLGSINGATLQYGVVAQKPLERDRLYWRKRQQFYEPVGGGGDMRKLAVEFHDATVQSIHRQGADLVLDMKVYVHRSERRPGRDAGDGWYQDAEARLVGGTTQQEPGGLPLYVSDGSMKIEGASLDNLLPLPCDLKGQVEIELSGADGTFRATGSGFTVTMKGVPGPVEPFHGSGG